MFQLFALNIINFLLLVHLVIEDPVIIVHSAQSFTFGISRINFLRIFCRYVMSLLLTLGHQRKRLRRN